MIASALIAKKGIHQFTCFRIGQSTVIRSCFRGSQGRIPLRIAIVPAFRLRSEKIFILRSVPDRGFLRTPYVFRHFIRHHIQRIRNLGKRTPILAQRR